MSAWTEEWHREARELCKVPFSAFDRREMAIALDEIERLRAALVAAMEISEKAYWQARKFIDNNVPDWTHGDDGPIYQMLQVTMLCRDTLEVTRK